MTGNANRQSSDTAESPQAIAEQAPPSGTEEREIDAGGQFSESNRRDVEIANSARCVLTMQRYLPSEQTPSVAVKNGWVTLWGEVERNYKRQPATRAVFRLQGVTGVTDLIAVRPAAPADPGHEPT